MLLLSIFVVDCWQYVVLVVGVVGVVVSVVGGVGVTVTVVVGVVGIGVFLCWRLCCCRC